jgi:hypothetical protein
VAVEQEQILEAPGLQLVRVELAAEQTAQFQHRLRQTQRQILVAVVAVEHITLVSWLPQMVAPV